MTKLTKKEILEELKELGIETPSERRICLREYKEYSVTQYLDINYLPWWRHLQKIVGNLGN
jgi:hypothetical protein